MSDLITKCAEAGLKMTGPRKVILRLLDEAEDHPSVETIYERAREIDSSISLATVYRTLNLLDEHDLVLRHEFQEGFSRFEVNQEHHHHLIDVETGDVVEFKNEELERIKEKIARELGYELVDHTLELYGRRMSKK